MLYDSELESVRAPLYGIGGLLGITLMALLFAGFPEVRWFALFSIPLGVLIAAAMRWSRSFARRRTRRLIWVRDVPHYRWPGAIG